MQHAAASAHPALAPARAETAVAVSAIVCTHARAGYLETCLAGLAAQVAGTPLFEVIVVDSASGPPAASRVAALAARHGARLVVAERPGLSLARNLGAAAASGTWLAYIDDDAVPDPDWIGAIVAAGAVLPRPVAIGGSIRPQFEAPLPAWWPPALVGALTVLEHPAAGDAGRDLPRGVEPYGANFIVRADALAAVGGFPEGLGRIGARLLSGEEILVLRRLAAMGGRIRFDPGVAVTHAIQARRLTPEWLLDRQYWQGISEVTLRRLLGERWRLWWRAARRLAAVLVLGPLLLGTMALALLRPAEPARADIGRRARFAFSLGYLVGLLHPARHAAQASPPASG